MDERTSPAPAGEPPDAPDAPGAAAERAWRDELLRSAVEAELATGRREPTEAKARANVFVRVSRMAFAVVLLLIGVACLVLPGPGLLLIAAGLAVLARDVAWAERLLVSVRKRIPGSDEDGQLSRTAIVVSVVLVVAGAVGSLYLALR